MITGLNGNHSWLQILCIVVFFGLQRHYNPHASAIMIQLIPIFPTFDLTFDLTFQTDKYDQVFFPGKGDWAIRYLLPLQNATRQA